MPRAIWSRKDYLGPADGAEKVYALLVKVMESSGLSAVARYVFHDKQQLGALRIRDGIITLENMPTTGLLEALRASIEATKGSTNRKGKPGRRRRAATKAR